MDAAVTPDQFLGKCRKLAEALRALPAAARAAELHKLRGKNLIVYVAVADLLDRGGRAAP